MKIYQILSESQVGKQALDYKRSNRYPDGTDIPESLPPRYQPADFPGVPKNQRCDNCGYYDTKTKKCDKFKGEPVVKPEYWCLKWEPMEEDVTEGSLNEFAPVSGPGGDNYEDDLHDILMVYIMRNEPGLINHFGKDEVDGVVANMVTMGTFASIDPNNKEDLADALDKIIDILNDDLPDPRGVAEVNELPGKDKVGGATAMPAPSPALKRILMSHIDELREFVKYGELDPTGDLFFELAEYFMNEIPIPVRQDPLRLERRIRNMIAPYAKFYTSTNLMNGQGAAEGSLEEGYGRYYCSTDKKWKTRKGPKQTRKSK